MPNAMLCLVGLTQRSEAVMPDDLKYTGPEDRSRINIHQSHELRYWSRELLVTPEKLIEAVKAVGVSVPKVRIYLALVAQGQGKS